MKLHRKISNSPDSRQYVSLRTFLGSWRIVMTAVAPILITATYGFGGQAEKFHQQQAEGHPWPTPDFNYRAYTDHVLHIDYTCTHHPVHPVHPSQHNAMHTSQVGGQGSLPKDRHVSHRARPSWKEGPRRASQLCIFIPYHILCWVSELKFILFFCCLFKAFQKPDISARQHLNQFCKTSWWDLINGWCKSRTCKVNYLQLFARTHVSRRATVRDWLIWFPLSGGGQVCIERGLKYFIFLQPFIFTEAKPKLKAVLLTPHPPNKKKVSRFSLFLPFWKYSKFVWQDFVS